MAIQDFLSRIGEALGGAAGFLDQGFQQQDLRKKYGPDFEEVMKEQELQRARAAENQKFREQAAKRAEDMAKMAKFRDDKLKGEHAADMEYAVQRIKNHDFGEISQAGPPSETAFNEYRERAEQLSNKIERASGDPDGQDAIDVHTQLRMMEAKERDKDRAEQMESRDLAQASARSRLEAFQEGQEAYPEGQRAADQARTAQQMIQSRDKSLNAEPDPPTPGEIKAKVTMDAMNNLGIDLSSLAKIGDEHLNNVAMAGIDLKEAQQRKVNAQVERVLQGLGAQGQSNVWDPQGRERLQTAAAALKYVGVDFKDLPEEFKQRLAQLELQSPVERWTGKPRAFEGQ
jgi:hypothetical protein